MLKSRKYKIIAAFLLFVFSLNTIAGFACSIGLNIEDNTAHHKYSKANTHSESHQHHNSSFEENAAPGLTDATHSSDCCKNDVISFNRLDKAIVSNNLTVQVPVLLLLLSPKLTFFSQNEGINGIALNAQFTCIRRGSSLQNLDIRIAIQSFQI